ncbi:MAG: exopolyphosphatase, partial [Candidatus Electrothrix sp. AX5]|nr:exopolyphosphatase [Candidatus Electrothrix sp. AX5]
AVLLRLATLLHRSRKDETAIVEEVVAEEEGLVIRFAESELDRHPLQLASLEQEADYLKQVGFTLRFSS